MTGHSLVPMAAQAAGIDYGTLCVQLLADATLDGRRDAPFEATGHGAEAPT